MTETQKAGRVQTPPCQALWWRLIVRPITPKEATAGGIVLPDEVIERNEVMSRVGQIVSIGTLAFEARSKAGLDLSKERNRPKVGDWVIYGEYAGQLLRVGDQDFRVIADTDVLAVTPDPDAFRHYV